MNLSALNTATPPRLEMRGVVKRFGATLALDGVDLTVRSGEVVALVGENGAGKSTLMKVLSGAHRADAGDLRLDGRPFRPANPLEARRAGVAMIYQELSLAPHLTVEDNLVLGLEPQRWGCLQRRVIRRRAQEALAHFGDSGIRPDCPVRQLSVAAQQLVEIARALVAGCCILVLDEPTSSLTAQDVARLFDLIRTFKQRGLAVVYISHFLEEVQAVADRIVVLRDGRTVGEGTPAELGVGEIVRRMVGREVRDLYPRTSRHPGDPLLCIEDLAGVAKPSEVSLTLRRGEVVGIAGLMGAGRTELLRCVFGLEPVRSGRVRVGIHAGPRSPVWSWARGIGLLSEDRKQEGLALQLDVADNITLPRLGGMGRAGWIGPRRQASAAAHWIDALGIRCRGPRQAVMALSGGNQQKVALARLLHSQVDVLLLDEPTRGIDVAAKAAIYRLIDDLASSAPGRAVLIVSSYLPELLGICDRIAVMCRGRLGPARPATAWTEHDLMLAATGQGPPPLEPDLKKQP